MYFHSNWWVWFCFWAEFFLYKALISFVSLPTLPTWWFVYPSVAECAGCFEADFSISAFFFVLCCDSDEIKNVSSIAKVLNFFTVWSCVVVSLAVNAAVWLLFLFCLNLRNWTELRGCCNSAAESQSHKWPGLGLESPDM